MLFFLLSNPVVEFFPCRLCTCLHDWVSVPSSSDGPCPALFRSCVYVVRSCVRSVVHHRLAYGEGLAFGVKSMIAEVTTSISLSVCCCTLPSLGHPPSSFAILSLISPQGAFLKSNLPSPGRSAVSMLSSVSQTMALLPGPIPSSLRKSTRQPGQKQSISDTGLSGFGPK